MLRIFLLVFCLFTFAFSAEMYENLEFSDNESAKVLILDKAMRLQKVISIPKGQKEIKLNLEDSTQVYISLLPNPKQDSTLESKEAPKTQDSKYFTHFKDSKQFNTQESLQTSKENSLEKGIENAPMHSAYQLRYSRNRTLGKFLGFEPHKFNYILPLSTSLRGVEGHAKRTEAKFQLSIKKLLVSDLLFKDLDLYFAYTQQSFWQVYDSANSRPFRESNYEPEIYFSYPLQNKNFLFERVNFGFAHQSNGGDITKSRSWNRLFAEGIYSYNNFALGLKTWYRIPEDSTKDDNPDIIDFLGYGELSLGYTYQKHLWTLTLRNNLQSDNKGAILLDYSYPIYKNLYLYLQYFSGYGESLQDYNRAIDRIGVGILFAR